MSGFSYSGKFNRKHALALLIAAIFFMAFWSLSRTSNSFAIYFKPPWNKSSLGELNFWGSFLSLLPVSSFFWGYGISPILSKLVLFLSDRWNRLSNPRWFFFAFLIIVSSILVCFLGNQLILLSYPITDDENAIRFGGQCLANGIVGVRSEIPQKAIPSLFFYHRENFFTSMDWLGGQLVWAAAIKTKLGNFFFAIINSIPLITAGLYARKNFSPSLGLGVMLILLFSPMYFFLGITTHNMLVSRALTALSIFLFFQVYEKDKFYLWIMLGFVWGMAFITRPFESTFLLMPFFFYLFFLKRKSLNEFSNTFGGLILGALIPLTIWLLHNYAVTGTIKPARLINAGKIVKFSFPLLSTRFGGNLSYNLQQILLWFYGPVGFLLVLFGAFRNLHTKLIGFSLIALLLLALTHDDHGIHFIGPIHYSDAFFPLVILSLHGLQNFRNFLEDHKFEYTQWSSGLLAAGILMSTSWIPLYSWSIYKSSLIHKTIYNQIEKNTEANSVIFAPQYASVWLSNPVFGKRGTYVFEWQRPSPDFSNSRLIFHLNPTTNKIVQKMFPDRKFYNLQILTKHPWFSFSEIKNFKRKIY